jgi:ATP-binding cassette subfamily B (MDR/TAP) protein 1
LQAATSQTLGYLVCDVFVFGACIVVALVYSYKLTFVMLATGVPSALILWGISRFLDPAIEGQKRELAQAAKHVTAATTAIDLVKVYNGADHEAFQFVSAIRRSAKFYSRQVLCNCGQMSYVKLWMIMLFVLGFYFAIMMVGRGELTPGDALTTFYAALIAFQSIETLGPQWLVVAKGMAAGQFLQELIKAGGCGSEKKNTGWLKPSWCLGDVRLSNVSDAQAASWTRLIVVDHLCIPIQPDENSHSLIESQVRCRPAYLSRRQQRFREEHAGQSARAILRAPGRPHHLGRHAHHNPRPQLAPPKCHSHPAVQLPI